MARRRRKKRISKVRQEYMKQRKRVGSIVTRARKKGYDISIKDVAGEIPARVTRRYVEELSAIRSLKQLFAKIPPKYETAPVAEIEPTYVPSRYDVVMASFAEQLDNYHPMTQAAINNFTRYIRENYGSQALVDAIAWAEEEGYYLSDNAGYLVSPEDLGLYLQRVAHMVVGDERNQSLTELMNKVQEIVDRYESYYDTISTRYG